MSVIKEKIKKSFGLSTTYEDLEKKASRIEQSNIDYLKLKIEEQQEIVDGYERMFKSLDMLFQKHKISITVNYGYNIIFKGTKQEHEEYISATKNYFIGRNSLLSEKQAESQMPTTIKVISDMNEKLSKKYRESQAIIAQFLYNNRSRNTVTINEKIISITDNNIIDFFGSLDSLKKSSNEIKIFTAQILKIGYETAKRNLIQYQRELSNKKSLARNIRLSEEYRIAQANDRIVRKL